VPARVPADVDVPWQLELTTEAGAVVTASGRLFAAAARRMDYSSLGMTQFLSPTIVFVLGVTVFAEPLRPIQLACFGFIWAAIAVFVWDTLARRRAISAQVAPT